jgi:hypothetical protein
MAVRETPLHAFANGSLWIKRVPLRFFGLQIGARMTVVRLARISHGGYGLPAVERNGARVGLG